MYFTQSLDTRAGSIEVNFGRMSMSDVFMALPVMGYLVSGGADSTPEAIFTTRLSPRRLRRLGE